MNSVERERQEYHARLIGKEKRRARSRRLGAIQRQPGRQERVDARTNLFYGGIGREGRLGKEERSGLNSIGRTGRHPLMVSKAKRPSVGAEKMKMERGPAPPEVVGIVPRGEWEGERR